MGAESWEKVKDLFHAALNYEPAKRAAFLDQACAGDQSLRAEVESLIDVHEKEGDFIEAPDFAQVAEILANSDCKPGTRIGHYEIVSKLGEGGMGEVYLAQDTNLMRQVALKMLPFATSDGLAQKRLLREARAAATLDHPNICAIYEVGEANGRSYIAMQYVDGQTLADRLIEGLSINETLDIALEVAEALSEAHARGLVHRDIKPANIVISDRGHAKVLDFGLAKVAVRVTLRS